MLRSKYLLNLPLAYGVYSESALALGMVDANYLSQEKHSPRFEHLQILSGFGEHLRFQIKTPDHSALLRVGGQGVFSSLQDDYGSWNDWDNYGFGLQGLLKSQLAYSAVARLSVEELHKHYNPEKYFFVEDWTQEFTLRSDLLVSPIERLELGPLINYKRWNIERDGILDLEKYEIGWKMVFQRLLPWKTDLFTQAIQAKWLHKEGKEYLALAGLNSKKLTLEIYRKTVQDKFLKENLTGLKLSWRFGPESRNELAELDHYGYVADRKYEFYRENGLKDNQALSMEAQAERLGTFRKRNEWSGRNLVWKKAPDNGWGFREADEAYTVRGGDCDEQACLNSYLDRLNGYQSNLLGWWPSDLPVGHAVQLIQDKTNGQWFMDEYGMLYKLKVDPTASRETVALEALKQTNRFTALPIKNGEEVLYTVINCDTPGTYQYLSFTFLENFQSENKRPPIEYGYELFTGRDLLFK